METLSQLFKKIKIYTKNVFRRLREWKHFLQVYHRAFKIRQVTDKTIVEKLYTITAKIEAIEKYGNKYCNPDRVGRLDARHNKKYYNKLKNDIKKELLILLYNY